MLEGPVALEREQPVSALLGDEARGFALAVQGITGDQRTLDVDQTQQNAGGDDLAFLVPGRDLADDHTRLGGKRGDDVERRAPGSPVEGAAHRLAIDGDDARASLAQPVEEPCKAGGKGNRVEQAEQPREGVAAGQAHGQVEEVAEQRFAVAGKVGEIHTAFGAADRRAERNREHVQ